MSPTAPTIDASGISAPQFADILAWLQDQYRAIYGADVYLGNDSQDGQFLGLIAAAINDSNAAAVACYNAFSPLTAQGNGLSTVVKINGITRLVPTASQVDVTIVGQAGTVITGGIVADADDVQWALPASVTIPLSGSILVTATCTELGAISAAPGTVTQIKTPTFGWQSVSNPTAAVEGQPVETDAALRVRQSLSVAVPSLTIFEGIVGSVANLAGVTRIRGYENDGDTADANGIPAHSIALIVEGGDATAIAQTIAEKKTPGTGTAGDITSTVIDSVGSSHIIRFSRPTVAQVEVALTITALPGWSVAIEPTIKQAIADYINGLAIGEDVEYFALFVPANLGNLGFASTYKVSAMQIARLPGALGMADIVVDFDEVAACDVSDISITVL